MQRNILNRHTEHYIFFDKTNPELATIIRGKDSYRGIRSHFIYRLTELLSNLEWALESTPKNKRVINEYEFFLNIQDKIFKKWIELGILKEK